MWIAVTVRGGFVSAACLHKHWQSMVNPFSNTSSDNVFYSATQFTCAVHSSKSLLMKSNWQNMWRQRLVISWVYEIRNVHSIEKRYYFVQTLWMQHSKFNNKVFIWFSCLHTLPVCHAREKRTILIFNIFFPLSDRHIGIRIHTSSKSLYEFSLMSTGLQTEH